MTGNPFDHFAEVWLVDFEFRQPAGGLPEPRCMVAREYHSGKTLRLWSDELCNLDRAPFPTDAGSLFVAYYASAELGCFLSFDWPLPERILDLYVEFRRQTNGLMTPCGSGLLGALSFFGLDAIGGAEKDQMRELALRDGGYTDAERVALLDYCESDVVALAKLLPCMLPSIDLPRALLRGRYMPAAARIERTGVPIDCAQLARLREDWTQIQGQLVTEIDKDFGVYIPTGSKSNPDSVVGAAVLDTAKEWSVDAYQLADAVQEVWSNQRQSTADLDDAKTAARKVTGLTAHRIESWENSGRDVSTYPDLDTTARELAADYPALGIGGGYDPDAGADETDYPGRLWSLLREPAEGPKPKHHPEILRQAVELVLSSGDDPPTGPLSFSASRWAEYLARHDIPWPRLESGALDLSDETFRQMARRYPQVAPIRELRHALSQLRLNDLAVGSDGRNRCMLSAFRARTSRNQPSNSRFIFGPSCWLRSLIQPAHGRAVAYVDWEQQEFGIAAALSGDGMMIEAYTSGDPYLAFAKQAGAVPVDATKQSHPQERGQFKVCALAVQYGMGAESLAASLGIPVARGRHLLQLHRETYPVFWSWSQAAVDHAMAIGYLDTVFGWRIHAAPGVNPRSLANYPMQANGAEMLRLACCLATERRISVCAPVHDALLVEGPADEIGAVVEATQAAMAEASRVVLDGFELRADSKIVTYPDRFSDERGAKMWKTVIGILDKQGALVAEGVPF